MNKKRGSSQKQPFPLTTLILRIVVAGQCVGVAARWLQSGKPSALIDHLTAYQGWSEANGLLGQNILAGGMIACAVFTLVRPCWPVLLPVAVWMGGESWMAVEKGLGFIPELEPVEHAVRIVAPLALCLWELWPPQVRFTRRRLHLCLWLLRLAAAATFIGHGIVAFNHNPQFLELLIAVEDEFSLRTFTDAQRKDILTAIGILDIAVAINLVLARLPVIAAYMAVWGLATAATRIVLLGWIGYPEFFVRLANGGVPLVILGFWIGLAKKPATDREE